MTGLMERERTATPVAPVRHRGRTAACVAAFSVLLLTPCFWQQRIQAGDLSSHIYNAWLAQLIEHGRAPGLTLAKQYNNILFDWMLSGLMSTFGPGPAQRIAVSAAVLVFFWGAFAFVWSRSRRREAPWQLAPLLAMLAYGWVFRMGFFNFHLSFGLCLGALALVQHRKAWRIGAAVLLCGVGYVAHPLPLAWAIGVLAYERIAEALAPRRRLWLAFGALAVLVLAVFLVGRQFVTRRDPGQLMCLTGADQLWIYGRGYIAFSVALLSTWALCFERVLNTGGVWRTILRPPFQLCGLTAATVALLPGAVLLPGYSHQIAFLAQRLSLASALLFCAVVASVRLPKPLVGAMAVMALLFFGMSYLDERSLNRLETRIERAVAQLPPGQRVVSALADPESRIPDVHAIDRVCVGRCYSYGNYEPSSGQFRVRADVVNAFVVADYADSWNIQTGSYVVQPRDLPLYNVSLCTPGSTRMCVWDLHAGAKVSSSTIRVLWEVGKG